MTLVHDVVASVRKLRAYETDAGISTTKHAPREHAMRGRRAAGLGQHRYTPSQHGRVKFRYAAIRFGAIRRELRRGALHLVEAAEC